MVFAVIEELNARGGLNLALRGRDSDSLATIVYFLGKHIRDPRYSNDATAISNILLDMYPMHLSTDEDKELIHAFTVLRERTNEEVVACHHFMELRGII